MDDGIKSEIRDKIIDILTALFPEAKIYLFGSRATGKYQRTSDIDIAIDAGHRVSNAAIDEANAVMDALNIVYKVQILDFYQVSPDFQESISRNKVIWKN